MTSKPVDQLEAPRLPAPARQPRIRGLTPRRAAGTSAIILAVWMAAATLPVITTWLMEQSCSIAGGPHCLPQAPTAVMLLSAGLVLVSAPIAWLLLGRWWAWLTPIAAVLVYIVALTVAFGTGPLISLLHGETWPWRWWTISVSGDHVGHLVGSMLRPS